MSVSLQYVHEQGILHRDLKTQNIMLDKKYKVHAIYLHWADVGNSFCV